MWPIIWLLIAFIALILWILLLIADIRWYKSYLIKQEKIKKAKAEALKKKIREFKWPEKLPYNF